MIAQFHPPPSLQVLSLRWILRHLDPSIEIWAAISEEARNPILSKGCIFAPPLEDWQRRNQSAETSRGMFWKPFFVSRAVSFDEKISSKIKQFIQGAVYTQQRLAIVHVLYGQRTTMDLQKSSVSEKRETRLPCTSFLFGSSEMDFVYRELFSSFRLS